MGVDLTEKYRTLSKELGGKYNPNFLFLQNEIGNFNHLVLQGGTRSGKTVAAIQFVWNLLNNYTGTTYSIVRQSRPTLKATVMKDFEEWGREGAGFNANYMNKTDLEYSHNGNVVDFFGAEDEEKLRGRKRNLAYVNEAPELSFEAVMQLQFRSDKMVYDFNPSYPDSWMYDQVMSRDDCAYIKTTYHDNPFLGASQIANIENLKLTDPELYNVYAKGERANLQGQIYKMWHEMESFDFPKHAKIVVIDWGFDPDPTAIIKAHVNGTVMQVKEALYRTELDTIDIAIQLFFMGVSNDLDKNIVIADSAAKQAISEMRKGWQDLGEDYIAEKAAKMGLEFKSDLQFSRLKDFLNEGIFVYAISKPPGSILDGIRKLNQYHIFVTRDSSNIWAEKAKYRWKVDKVTGKMIDTPAKSADHLLDCIRYLALAHNKLFYDDYK